MKDIFAIIGVYATCRVLYKFYQKNVKDVMVGHIECYLNDAVP